MRIKIYIVTYNNDDILKKNISLIKKSDIVNYDYSIHIVNNYSKLNESFIDNDIEILDNVLRPDFSSGHLSRSWNQCIINGFKDISNPDCDILILMQNDTFIKPNIFNKIVDLSNHYDFIQFGAGDQFMIFNKNSIKIQGIFDERFCGIGFQEADYFLSSVLLNPEKVSINDYKHGRVHNPINLELIEKDYNLNNNSYKLSDPLKYHDYNNKIFYKKWNFKTEHWEKSPSGMRPLIERFMFYPYFEMNINTLEEQNYFK